MLGTSSVAFTKCWNDTRPQIVLIVPSNISFHNFVARLDPRAQVGLTVDFQFARPLDHFKYWRRELCMTTAPTALPPMRESFKAGYWRLENEGSARIVTMACDQKVSCSLVEWLAIAIPGRPRSNQSGHTKSPPTLQTLRRLVQSERDDPKQLSK